MEPPTYQALIAAAQFVWLIGITVAVALRKPGEEAGEAVASLKEKIQEQDRHNAEAIASIRAQGELIQERMKHLPTNGEVHKLVQNVAELRGQLQVVIEGQERWQRVTERIEDWLNNSRRGS